MIDSRAIVDSAAKIADNVEIGPFSIIGPDVEIGEGTVIGPHVIVRGPTKIGKNNRIFQFASIGEECQDKKYAGEPTRLEIGDNNVIREACTLHRGTIQDNSLTKVGSDNLFMVNVHVAHDCVIGDHGIFANDTNIAGHVKIGDWVILGGSTQVHQFCSVGSHAMAGAGSVVLKDIPAYIMAQGYPATPHGMNTEGLRRRGFSPESISLLRKAYKTVYRKSLTLAEALAELDPIAAEDPAVKLLTDSLHASTRGIIR
ncbi:MAG: acyl-ACP--UDP-N-acetylglucosamine O-acyltransferase [Oleibacter sp.]|nr:acyl-ACP--UDP-N-acetylglucosamine O-acyltransferase [Thalassolituus sp.]